MTKDTQIIVRMNEQEKERLQAAAFKAGLSMSEYIRKQLKDILEKT